MHPLAPGVSGPGANLDRRRLGAGPREADHLRIDGELDHLVEARFRHVVGEGDGVARHDRIGGSGKRDDGQGSQHESAGDDSRGDASDNVRIHRGGHRTASPPSPVPGWSGDVFTQDIDQWCTAYTSGKDSPARSGSLKWYG